MWCDAPRQHAGYDRRLRSRQGPEEVGLWQKTKDGRERYTRTILSTPCTCGYDISYKRVLRALPHKPQDRGVARKSWVNRGQLIGSAQAGGIFSVRLFEKMYKPVLERSVRFSMISKLRSYSFGFLAVIFFECAKSSTTVFVVPNFTHTRRRRPGNREYQLQSGLLRPRDSIRPPPCMQHLV